MSTMSPDLIAFLKAWYHWATNGAPDGHPFRRSWGLCANARDKNKEKLGDKLFLEMGRQFAGERFPFGEADHWIRAMDKSQHECPKRLAWVRERLIEAGEIEA